MKSLLFVYGTLKRGCRNHHRLATQRFVGAAHSVAGYRLYDLGDYPGIVPEPTATEGVVGEVWEVDEECLRELDRFEGVDDGLYRRDPINLEPPFGTRRIDAYFAARSVVGCREVGPEWIE